MKIVVLTGSPHRKGTSELLAERFIEGANKAGMRFFVLMQHLPMCIHV